MLASDDGASSMFRISPLGGEAHAFVQEFVLFAQQDLATRAAEVTQMMPELFLLNVNDGTRAF